jgi:hypothetical protein
MSVVGYWAMKGGKTARGAGTGGIWAAAIIYGIVRDVRAQLEAAQGMRLETDMVVRLTIEGR